jgi:cobalt-zinc-cadmium resistance protein CzcA
MSRLRPVLMTALVASLGFIPMAVSTGSVGNGGNRGTHFEHDTDVAELLILPVLYELVETRFMQRDAALP